MNQLFVCIAKDKSAARVPFLPLNGKEQLPLNKSHLENYSATGRFGQVFCKRWKISELEFQLFEMELGEEIQIYGTKDPGNMFLIFNMLGAFVLQSGLGNRNLCLMAQSQCKMEYISTPFDYNFKVKPTADKIYSIFSVTVGLPYEYESYIGRPDFTDKHSGALTTTIEMQLLFSIILEEIEKITPSIIRLRAYLNALLLSAVDILRKNDVQDDTHSELVESEEKLIYQIAEYIILGLDEPWTLKKLAASGKLTTAKIKMLFKKYLGLPTAAFRVYVRLQKAKQLLLEKDMSIREISISVGYANPGQFASIFRRKEGCSPSQFRKREGIKNDKISLPA
jgi:AraC-like DNA-binding protein